jgi:hypothetical protein
MGGSLLKFGRKKENQNEVSSLNYISVLSAMRYLMVKRVVLLVSGTL